MSERRTVGERVRAVDLFNKPSLDLGDGVTCVKRSKDGVHRRYLYQITHGEKGDSVGRVRLTREDAHIVTFEISFKDEEKTDKFFEPTLQRLAGALAEQDFDLVTKIIDPSERAFWVDLAVRGVVKPLDLSRPETTEYMIRPLEENPIKESGPPTEEIPIVPAESGDLEYPSTRIMWPEDVAEVKRAIKKNKRKKLRDRMVLGPVGAAVVVTGLLPAPVVSDGERGRHPKPARSHSSHVSPDRDPLQAQTLLTLMGGAEIEKQAASALEQMKNEVAEPFQVDLTDPDPSSLAQIIWHNMAGSYVQYPRDNAGNILRMARVVDGDIWYITRVKTDQANKIIRSSLTKKDSQEEESVVFNQNDYGVSVSFVHIDKNGLEKKETYGTDAISPFATKEIIEEARDKLTRWQQEEALAVPPIIRADKFDS